jgi:hypothetical protein
MVFPRTDDELQNWLRWELENGSSFLRAIAEAALVADLKHYNLLRPVLLGLKDGESRSANSSTVLDRELKEDKGLDPPGPRIRCPLCGWSPRKEDKWFCECGYEWNTFDTGGVCPACLHQWSETQCLSCSRWSPHSEWYTK